MGEIPGTKRAKLHDLHSALVRYGRANKCMSEMIPVERFEQIIVQALGEVTRQSVQDTAYAMDRYGMIRRVPRKGVIVLDREIHQAPDQLLGRSGLVEAAT